MCKNHMISIKYLNNMCRRVSSITTTSFSRHFFSGQVGSGQPNLIKIHYLSLLAAEKRVFRSIGEVGWELLNSSIKELFEAEFGTK